jgi:outer membrane protein TolC
MKKIICTGLLALMAARTQPAAADVLQLDEAVQIALQSEDPSLLLHDVRAAALEERAVADAQLPDPTIRTALANFPTDSFRFEQEPMTQVQFGLRQEFPAGQTLSLKGKRRETEAEVERARRMQTLRQIELAVRTAWFDLYHWQNGQALVRASRAQVDDLIETLSANFATGRIHLQDVLRGELELAMFDDRLTDMQRQADIARAALARYVGEAVDAALPTQFPTLDTPRSEAEIEADLVKHPAVLIEDKLTDAAGVDIELAKEAYKPSWSLDGGYGLRGGGRADFVSVGVTLSVPLFTGRRQDRRLSAAVQEQGAAKLDRATLLLELRRDLGTTYANWIRYGQRIQLYERTVTARAEETADASVSTYAQGVADFPELIRAHLARLDAELKLLELRTERAKAWARLEYLTGDRP